MSENSRIRKKERPLRQLGSGREAALAVLRRSPSLISFLLYEGLRSLYSGQKRASGKKREKIFTPPF